LSDYGDYKGKEYDFGVYYSSSSGS
jgi:hypothetical protein